MYTIYFIIWLNLLRDTTYTVPTWREEKIFFLFLHKQSPLSIYIAVCCKKNKNNMKIMHKWVRCRWLVYDDENKRWMMYDNVYVPQRNVKFIVNLQPKNRKISVVSCVCLSLSLNYNLRVNEAKFVYAYKLHLAEIENPGNWLLQLKHDEPN